VSDEKLRAWIKDVIAGLRYLERGHGGKSFNHYPLKGFGLKRLLETMPKMEE